GGFFRFEYLARREPPVDAVEGMGLVALCEAWLAGGWRAALLPASLLATAAWQLWIDRNALGWMLDGSHALHIALAAGALVSTGALLGLTVWRPDGPRPLGRTARMLAAGAVTIGLAA